MTTLFADIPEAKKKVTWKPPADCPRVLTDPPRWLGRAGDQHTRSGWGVQHASEVLRAAAVYFRPVRIYACFSGGYDSIVPVVHLMGRSQQARDGTRSYRGIPVEVLHVNTGIGIEATREFVRETCERQGWPLREVRTPTSYEDLVLGKVDGYPGGFPGPAMHGLMYQRLKERAIRLAVAEAKRGHPRNAAVLLVSGIRADESQKRTGYARTVSKVDSQVWLNPFYWSGHDVFTDYRTWTWMPKNPVKEALGMSGECACGAFAEPGELERIGWACPATRDYLLDLQRRVRAAGFPWGWEDPGPPRGWKGTGPDGVYTPAAGEYRPMCRNCDKVHLLRVAAARATQMTLFDPA